MAGGMLAVCSAGAKPRRLASVANSSRLSVPFPSWSKSRSTAADCDRFRSMPRSPSIARISPRESAPLRSTSYRSNMRTTAGWCRGARFSSGGAKPRRYASAANSSRLRVPLPSASNLRSNAVASARFRSRWRALSPFFSSRAESACVPFTSKRWKARTMAGWGPSDSGGGTKPRLVARAANSARLSVPLPSTSKSRRIAAACSLARSSPRSRSTRRSSDVDRAPVRFVSLRSNVRTTSG
mmetsp:Transcript_22323/g.72138  ORF Transcript_22323/g.72138 Transcript_22323/m.72138 type:complete len:240 (-) Transcript_22323:3342-4061(-)